jgi:hypothetical protein
MDAAVVIPLMISPVRTARRTTIPAADEADAGDGAGDGVRRADAGQVAEDGRGGADQGEGPVAGR